MNELAYSCNPNARHAARSAPRLPTGAYRECRRHWRSQLLPERWRPSYRSCGARYVPSRSDEALWSDWLAGTLDVPPFVRVAFDLDAAPEPYLSLGVGAEPLVALTTNPGEVMPHQRRGACEREMGR